jgi:hypothetical protein
MRTPTEVRARIEELNEQKVYDSSDALEVITAIMELEWVLSKPQRRKR